MQVNTLSIRILTTKTPFWEFKIQIWPDHSIGIPPFQTAKKTGGTPLPCRHARHCQQHKQRGCVKNRRSLFFI